jgi:hypothetical protein
MGIGDISCKAGYTKQLIKDYLTIWQRNFLSKINMKEEKRVNDYYLIDIVLPKYYNIYQNHNIYILNIYLTRNDTSRFNEDNCTISAQRIDIYNNHK